MNDGATRGNRHLTGEAPVLYSIDPRQQQVGAMPVEEDRLCHKCRTKLRKKASGLTKEAGEAQREWYVVDATGLTLGRLASRIAAVLRGKHKPSFTPNVDMGDFVIVLNAGAVKLTGTKPDKKIYYHSHPVSGRSQDQTRETCAC